MKKPKTLPLFWLYSSVHHSFTMAQDKQKIKRYHKLANVDIKILGKVKNGMEKNQNIQTEKKEP